MVLISNKSRQTKNQFNGSQLITIFYASAILIGTAIGAGILGLPYALKDNIRYGFLVLFVIAIVMIITNTMLSHLMYNSKQKHQLAGYVGEQLGQKGKLLMTIVFSISMYGAILAYLSGIAQILFIITGISIFLWYGLLTFIVLVITYKGINYLKNSELFLTSLLLLFVLFISFYSLKSNSFSNLNFNDYKINIFSMLGITLFAFMNTITVPELNEVFKFNKNYLKNMFFAILIGSLIPLVVYGIFAYGIIGVNALTFDIATLSLIDLFGAKMGLFANSIAIFSMFTSYIAMSYGVFQMYFYDYDLNKNESLFFTIFVPFVLIFLLYYSRYSFVDILDFTGNVAGTFQGLLIVLSYFVLIFKFEKSSLKKYFKYFVVLLISSFYLLMFFYYLVRVFS